MNTSQIQDIVQRYEEWNWRMSRVYKGVPCTRIRAYRYRCGRPYTQGVPFYTLVVGSIESQGIE